MCIRDSYNSFNEINTSIGLYLRSVTGLSDDVRISERINLPRKRLRGFQSGKVGPVDANDHVGGNYAAALNFQSNLPFLFPSFQSVDFNYFIDAANVWGVDYDSTINESNKLRSSTGVAVDWSSPIGPISFIFATNLSKASTDKTESFNFNLGTSF